MLKYVNTDIVFQEIPDEVTLAVNLSGCPCRCPGCHSKYLWGDTGTPLGEQQLEQLIADGRPAITCLALMGGDAQPDEVDHLLTYVRNRHPELRTAWYSGRSLLSPKVTLSHLNYLKLGPYLAHLGPLSSPRTNQRMYKVDPAGHLHDITRRFRRAAYES
ncbi:MAG: anaerobic ribonucleoside-triphosphate reductase activating protein [Bacteroidales bacterium]|nr:anaerobic ribonucleoside-triphosphate reductase activating protein [Bacteroidales bacterium]